MLERIGIIGNANGIASSIHQRPSAARNGGGAGIVKRIVCGHDAAVVGNGNGAAEICLGNITRILRVGARLQRKIFSVGVVFIRHRHDIIAAVKLDNLVRAFHHIGRFGLRGHVVNRHLDLRIIYRVVIKRIPCSADVTPNVFYGKIERSRSFFDEFHFYLVFAGCIGRKNQFAVGNLHVQQIAVFCNGIIAHDVAFRNVYVDVDIGAGHQHIAAFYLFARLIKRHVVSEFHGSAAAHKASYLFYIKGIAIVRERNSLIFSREIAAAEQTHTRRVVGGKQRSVLRRVSGHSFVKHQCIVDKHEIIVVYARHTQLERAARARVYVYLFGAVLPRTVIFVQIQPISAVNAVSVPTLVDLGLIVQRVDEQPHPAVFLGEFRFLIINIAHGAVGVKISGGVHISAVYARKPPSAAERIIRCAARIGKRTAEIALLVTYKVYFLLFLIYEILDDAAVYRILHIIEGKIYISAGIGKTEVARRKAFAVIMRHYFVI